MTETFFRILLKVKPSKAESAKYPRRMLDEEILTGYIAETMHRNFYLVNKVRRNL